MKKKTFQISSYQSNLSLLRCINFSLLLCYSFTPFQHHTNHHHPARNKYKEDEEDEEKRGRVIKDIFFLPVLFKQTSNKHNTKNSTQETRKNKNEKKKNGSVQLSTSKKYMTYSDWERETIFWGV